MGTERLSWLLGAGALLAGLVLRLWFLHHAPISAGDAVIYSTIAHNLLRHGTYGFNQHTALTGQIVFEPTLIRLPGYPFFLALVFSIFGVDNLRAVLDIQVLADLLTCVLVAALARRLFGRRPALIVLWLAALCPFTANYTAIILTETLVLLTIALALYGFYRWMESGGGLNPWLWITAASLAASLLLRPEQGLFAAAILPAMLWFEFRCIQQKQESIVILSGAKDPLLYPPIPPADKKNSVILSEARSAESKDPLLYRNVPPGPKDSVILSERSESKDLLLDHNAWLRASIPAIAAALFILLPFIPWTARNWRTFHVFQPLAPKSATDPGEPPSPGFNHWYRTWALDFTTTDTVYWNIDGDRILPADLPDRAFALGCTAPAGIPRQQLPLYAQTVALLTDYNRTTLDPPALDARFEALARRHAANEPLCNYVLLPAGRLVNMLLRPRVEILPIPDEWWKPSRHPAQRRFALAYAALNLAYLALGLWGLLRWLRLLRVSPTQNPCHPERGQRAEGPRQISDPPQPPDPFSPERTCDDVSARTDGPNPATILLAATIATVLLRLALLLTLDNSEPRYTLELFPILFLWSAALFTPSALFTRSTPPQTPPSS